MKSERHQHFLQQGRRGYIADVPDLVFCSAFGASPEKALAELKKAKAAWLKAAKASGKKIPKPRYRPVLYQGVG